MRRDDIPALAALVKRNYSARFGRLSKAELEDMFGPGPKRLRPLYFVAEDRRTVVGFAGCMQSWLDYDVYEVFWVNVDPARQGQGLGKALVRKILQDLHKRDAAIVTLTARIPKYYARHFGFKTIASFKDRKLMALTLHT